MSNDHYEPPRQSALGQFLDSPFLPGLVAAFSRSEYPQVIAERVGRKDP